MVTMSSEKIKNKNTRTTTKVVTVFLDERTIGAIADAEICVHDALLGRARKALRSGGEIGAKDLTVLTAALALSNYIADHAVEGDVPDGGINGHLRRTLAAAVSGRWVKGGKFTLSSDNAGDVIRAIELAEGGLAVASVQEFLDTGGEEFISEHASEAPKWAVELVRAAVKGKYENGKGFNAGRNAQRLHDAVTVLRAKQRNAETKMIAQRFEEFMATNQDFLARWSDKCSPRAVEVVEAAKTGKWARSGRKFYLGGNIEKLVEAMESIAKTRVRRGQ